MASDGVISKGDFARLCGVTPGRVSQWLSEGKIKGDAIVGAGRMAKIDASRAQSQLNLTLDISQRLGNGIDTNLGGPGQGLEEKIKAARLTSLEAANRRVEEEDRLARGTYMASAEARQEMARIAGMMITIFEGSLTELATGLSAKFEIPQRDVLHALQTQFREVRASAAERLNIELDAEDPFTVDDSGHDNISSEPETGRNGGDGAGDSAAGAR